MTPVIFLYLVWFLCAQVSSGNCDTMESCKICIYDPKASESYFFKYIKLGLFATDTAPYISFSGNQALQSHYMNISRGRDRSCLPYAKSFQKIQLASKWNMTFQVIPIKKTSVSNRISEKKR